jgi:hypothetical protein
MCPAGSRWWRGSDLGGVSRHTRRWTRGRRRNGCTTPRKPGCAEFTTLPSGPLLFIAIATADESVPECPVGCVTVCYVEARDASQLDSPIGPVRLTVAGDDSQGVLAALSSTLNSLGQLSIDEFSRHWPLAQKDVGGAALSEWNFYSDTLDRSRYPMLGWASRAGTESLRDRVWRTAAPAHCCPARHGGIEAPGVLGGFLQSYSASSRVSGGVYVE